MKPFTALEAVAVPIDWANVDTDALIPGPYVKKDRPYAQYLFHDLRYDADGNKKPDFVLNLPEFANGQIIVAAENFGCGSSREHAVWALVDAGITCVIAVSLGDIFHNNCTKNGVCPILLSSEECAEIRDFLWADKGSKISVDLEKQTVSAGSKQYAFEISNFTKHKLLNGLEDTDYTMRHSDDIMGYEKTQAAAEPWRLAIESVC